MMADSVEAGSKSLKSPTVDDLKNFINKIINNQMADQQFNSSDITFAEIELIEKFFTKN